MANTNKRDTVDFWKHQLEYCQKELNLAKDHADIRALEDEIIIAIDQLIDLTKTPEERSQLKQYIWKVVINNSK